MAARIGTGWAGIMFAVLGLATFAALPAAFGVVQLPHGSNGDLRNAASLIIQLSDQSFTTRERATDQLVQLGAAAIPALEKGLVSGDRETRFRCQHALKIVRVLDFRRRLSAFENGQEMGENYALPGWKQFRDEFSSNSESRRLFVQMQRQERELLRVLTESPEELADAILNRVADLRQYNGIHPQEAEVSLGTVATLLFTANSCTTELPREASDFLSSYLRGGSFSRAMQSGSERELLRKMLGHWIEGCHGWSAFQGLLLSLQYSVPEGLVTAERVLDARPGQPMEPLVRSYALLTVAKFGDRSKLDLVESLLDDETPFGVANPINGATKFQTQIRDVALATAIRLAGEEFSDYGLDRIRAHSFYVFNTNTVGFENDVKRLAAIKKWQTFRSQSQKPDSE